MTDLSPREIVSELDRYIVGQDDAKRAMAVALRNRWRRKRVPEDLRDEVTPKNILMIGPTGVGKTEIARRLARLAGSPFLKVEATKFTEVGYVGRDVEQIVRDLVDAAIVMVRAEMRERVKASAHEAAETRVITTLIGTTVGMVFPLLFPPAIPVRSAAAAVRRAASALAGVLRRSSEYVDENPVTKAGVDRGIDGVRRVTADIGKASEAITQIRDLRRWNTRAIGKADVAPLLDTGLESLQSCAALTRVALQTIRQEAPEQTVADDAFGEEVRKVFAVVLTDLAECVESFGVLLEAETAGREEEVRAQFATNVNLLNETRAMLTELMLVSPEETDAWMLRGTILQAIDEVLHTLDAGTRDQIREDWRWTQAGLELGSTVVGPAIPNPLDRMALRRMQRRAALLRQRSLNVDADFGNEDTTQTLPVISPITPTDPREG